MFPSPDEVKGRKNASKVSRRHVSNVRPILLGKYEEFDRFTFPPTVLSDEKRSRLNVRPRKEKSLVTS